MRSGVNSALAWARAIEHGRISPDDLAAACRRRIAAHDGELAAFIEVFPPNRPVDTAGPRPAGWGVPIAIKDANAVRGHRTRFGSASVKLNGWTPVDDIVVARLRAAGLVLLGKTQTSEGGALPVTETAIAAPTRNPWDPARSGGGSSGGSAVAVATGMVPWALGSDGGGSIRIPSAFCGVVGHKPTQGRVTNPFLRDSTRLFWTCGPIADSVVDARALLEIMERPRATAWARWIHRSQRRRAAVGELESLTRPLGAAYQPRPILIRWTTQTILGAAEHRRARSVEDAIDRLVAMGHRCEPGAVLDACDPKTFLPLWRGAVASTPLRDLDRVQPFTRWLIRDTPRLSGTQLDRLLAEIRRRVDAWFGDADLWLTPTVPSCPPLVGAWSRLPPPEIYAQAAQVAAFTALFNIGGHPACSIPTGFDDDGLPVAIQIVGRRGRDALVLDVAEQLEQAFAFASKRRDRARRLPWGHEFPGLAIDDDPACDPDRG